ncbi:MAG: helix-turn-helix transcriptional regulator [Thermoplasmatota archaeon]
MPRRAEAVFAYIQTHPGVTDDELVRRLHLPSRAAVAAVCRRLEEDGRVERRKEGRIVRNLPVGSVRGRAPPESMEEPVASRAGHRPAVSEVERAPAEANGARIADGVSIGPPVFVGLLFDIFPSASADFERPGGHGSNLPTPPAAMTKGSGMLARWLDLRPRVATLRVAIPPRGTSAPMAMAFAIAAKGPRVALRVGLQAPDPRTQTMVQARDTLAAIIRGPALEARVAPLEDGESVEDVFPSLLPAPDPTARWGEWRAGDWARLRWWSSASSSP